MTASAQNTTNTRIKICGLRRTADIEAVNRIKPDFCGFIIEFPRSFRSITTEKARQLTQKLDSGILPVGVFVDAPPELPAELLNDGTIAMAQLHGHEDEEYIRKLRQLTDKPLIKAFSIKTAEDGQRALQSSADYILLDQGSGGTGRVFDWSLVPEIDRDFFLAGGLGANNLAEAIDRFHPFAVDVSSSVETRGWKDPEKIKRVVDIVRNYNKWL